MLHNRQAPGRDFHEHLQSRPSPQSYNNSEQQSKRHSSNPQSAPAPRPQQGDFFHIVKGVSDIVNVT